MGLGLRQLPATQVWSNKAACDIRKGFQFLRW